MNAAEHYAEAERCLQVAEGTYWQGPTADIEFAQTSIAAAQVHATLAAIPESQIAIYYATQRRLIERLTEDHCLDAFRTAWEHADAENDKGNRVLRGMTAAIEAALL